ncbi:MAG: carbohydrate binding family 9 domain-containing protein [Acidobacteria bacterium]|nr:carbohydrate binding family 9 domain-containing protein [Acidobacteriota bacterium]
MTPYIRLWLFLVGALVSGHLSATLVLAAEVHIPRVSQPPRLEDFRDMNSPTGNGMLRIDNFTQRTPDDGAQSSQPTVVYLGYDQQNFYAVFVCSDREPEKIRARMARREDIFADDRVGIILDTFHDRRRAFVFMANPHAIQADALYREGGVGVDGLLEGRAPRRGDSPFSFDTLWHTSSLRTDDGYVIRLAIPFKSLRFPSRPQQTWGIVLVRAIPRNNETSFWPPVTNRVSGLLQQAATLNGIEGISLGRNLQFVPFGFFRSSRALDELNREFVRDRADVDIGLDTKVVLRDSLVLDITLNPDFSQVESDEPQVTVNQRFEVFFPEKRPFFLENASFFATPINLVFTRRIADPQMGVRLTGKVGNTAIGVLFTDDQAPGRVVTADDPLFGKRARIGILRISHDILEQSSLGAIFTNREIENGYNRVGGIDGRLKFSPTWDFQFQGLASSTRTVEGELLAGPAYNARLGRSGRSFDYSLSYDDFSAGFNTDLGFVRRVDLRELRQFTVYRFWANGGHLISWTPRLFLRRNWDHSGVPQDWTTSPGISFDFRRRTRFEVQYRNNGEFFEGIRFSKRRLVVEAFSAWIPQVEVDLRYQRGTEINFDPPDGLNPSLGQLTNIRLRTTFLPITPLRIENSYFFTRLKQRETGISVFNNHILRSKVNYQINRELSLRLILQYDANLVNSTLTSLTPTKRFTGDFLITYLVNPGTALFIGYSNALENLDPRLIEVNDELLRTRRSLLETSKQFFVKFSYLFRF